MRTTMPAARRTLPADPWLISLVYRHEHPMRAYEFEDTADGPGLRVGQRVRDRGLDAAFAEVGGTSWPSSPCRRPRVRAGSDARLTEGTEISRSRREEQAAERRMELAIDTIPVVHGASGGENSRLAVIERLVEPVVAGSGGCVLVVCNRVGDAQETYTRLKDMFQGRGLADEDLQILHARFPGDVREDRTRGVTGGMGRSGPRPERRIVLRSFAAVRAAHGANTSSQRAGTLANGTR